MQRVRWLGTVVVLAVCAFQACATPAGSARTNAAPASAGPSRAASDSGSTVPAGSRPSIVAEGGGGSASSEPAESPGSTAEEYLRWAGESNDAMDELWAKYPRDFASLGEAALFYREYAEITRRFADRMLAMEFPPAIADDARDLVRRLTEEVNAAMRASQASTWDELWTAAEDLDRVSGFSTDAANRVRAGLGLPSAPPIGSDEEP